MKYIYFLLSNMLFGSVDAQIDSLKKNSAFIMIDAGMPMTIFLNNYAQNNNFTPGLFNPFTEYLPPFTIGINIVTESRNIIGFNYLYFDKSNTSVGGVQGDVIGRFYHIVMSEVGRSIVHDKFFLSPKINLSYRFSGTEEVVIGNIPSGFREPIIQTFQYNSLGIGLGCAFKYYFINKFYLSTDLRFTHYFETNKPSREYGGFDDFYNSYRVNRDAISVSLNLGYQIKINNKKI